MKAHIRITSSDGTYFDIPEQVVWLFPTIGTMIDENQEVLLTEVNPNVFPMIIEWSLKHLDDQTGKKSGKQQVKIGEWDTQFMENRHPWDLLEIIVAAHFLGSTPLRDIAAKKVAEMIEENPAEENDLVFGERAQELLELIKSHQSR